MDSGLAWSVLLLIMMSVITVVKILWVQPSESATNFDHCDDEYRLLIRVLTMLNHC